MIGERRQIPRAWSHALLIGPVFTREVAIAPRRLKLYVARTAYALALLVLMSTAWLVLTGTQLVRDVGDLARFGAVVFQILAPLQLALAAFFSALLAASEVAHEKDRRTLVLLLLTNLSNAELVLGKLLASLLSVLVMLAAALPRVHAGGPVGRRVVRADRPGDGRDAGHGAGLRQPGLDVGPVAREDVPGAGDDRAGPGALAGRRRDRGRRRAGREHGWRRLSCQALAAGFSPWQAILEAARPYVHAQPALGPFGSPVTLFLVAGRGDPAAAERRGRWPMVRVWNPSREATSGREERGEGETSSAERVRDESRLPEHSRRTSRHPPSPSSPLLSPLSQPAACGTTRSSGGRSAPGPTAGRCSWCGWPTWCCSAWPPAACTGWSPAASRPRTPRRRWCWRRWCC